MYYRRHFILILASWHLVLKKGNHHSVDGLIPPLKGCPGGDSFDPLAQVSLPRRCLTCSMNDCWNDPAFTSSCASPS